VIWKSVGGGSANVTTSLGRGRGSGGTRSKISIQSAGGGGGVEWRCMSNRRHLTTTLFKLSNTTDVLCNRRRRPWLMAGPHFTCVRWPIRRRCRRIWTRHLVPEPVAVIGRVNQQISGRIQRIRSGSACGSRVATDAAAPFRPMDKRWPSGQTPDTAIQSDRRPRRRFDCWTSAAKRQVSSSETAIPTKRQRSTRSASQRANE
jgi:hypothetical protein